MVLSMETGSARFSRRHPEHYSTLPADHEEILRASLRGAVEVETLVPKPRSQSHIVYPADPTLNTKTSSGPVRRDVQSRPSCR
jgi:hypothetical protein